jgi:hypothetical protein
MEFGPFADDHCGLRRWSLPRRSEEELGVVVWLNSVSVIAVPLSFGPFVCLWLVALGLFPPQAEKFLLLLV